MGAYSEAFHHCKSIYGCAVRKEEEERVGGGRGGETYTEREGVRRNRVVEKERGERDIGMKGDGGEIHIDIPFPQTMNQQMKQKYVSKALKYLIWNVNGWKQHHLSPLVWFKPSSFNFLPKAPSLNTGP